MFSGPVGGTGCALRCNTENLDLRGAAVPAAGVPTQVHLSFPPAPFSRALPVIQAVPQSHGAPLQPCSHCSDIPAWGGDKKMTMNVVLS